MAEITEKTPIKLTMRVFISMIVAVSMGLVYVFGLYSGLTGTDKELKKELDGKADKQEYRNHAYTDSVKFDYFSKDIKKDLRQIKRGLKIEDENKWIRRQGTL